jgi:hypothetical protein
MITSVEVKIQNLGLGLLMHAFPMEPIEALEKKPIEEQAEFAAYRCPESHNLYFPATNLQRALVAGATYSKGKGRASLQKSAAACLMLSPERLTFGVSKFTIDSRPVVIPATKGRVMRHRPKLENWALSFTLEFDDTLITPAQARRIVDDTGTRVGIGDFRPERKGPFGRFVVVSWAEPDAKKHKK